MGDRIQLRKSKECFIPASVGFLWVKLGGLEGGLGPAPIFLPSATLSFGELGRGMERQDWEFRFGRSENMS